MDAHTMTWLAVWLATGLAALVGTVHFVATDDTVAEIRAKLRARRESTAHSTIDSGRNPHDGRN